MVGLFHPTLEKDFFVKTKSAYIMLQWLSDVWGCRSLGHNTVLWNDQKLLYEWDNKVSIFIDSKLL